MTQTTLAEYEPAASPPDPELPNDPPRTQLSPFDIGDLVSDRADPDGVAIVLDPFVGRADEVVIDEIGMTIAEYPTNEAYPEDDPVVKVAYEIWLDRHAPGWREQAREELPAWLDTFTAEWQIPRQMYDYPANRLQAVDLDD